MKKVRILLATLLAGAGNYMIAQVGVNTTAPKVTLDVVGTPGDTQKTDGVIVPRITGEQLKNKDNLYGSDQDGTIIYVTQPLTNTTTSSRTVNVLRKGYYSFNSTKGTSGEWVKMFYNSPDILAGGTAGSAHPGAAVILSSTDGNTSVGDLETRTFTLTEKSVVVFTMSVPVTNVLGANGSALSDGASKGYGSNLFLSGGSFNNALICRQGVSFTNSGNFYTTGVFQVGASRTLVLDPGTYTARIRVYVYAVDTIGIRASFGTGADTVFDIIGQIQ